MSGLLVTLVIIVSRRIAMVLITYIDSSSFLIFFFSDKSSMYEVKVIVHTLDGLKSEAAEEFSSFNILKPAGPTNLRVITKSSDSFSIQWDEPKSDREITSFTVRYKPTDAVNYQFINRYNIFTSTSKTASFQN